MAARVPGKATAAASKMTALNCLNLSNCDIQKSISLLKQACLDSGFFYVIDHGISQDLINEVFVQSRRFFELPLHKKMELLRNEKHRGYTPTLDELLDRKNQVDGDYKEGYYIGVEVLEDDPQAEKPFYGPNQWPSEDILPGWRSVMEQYHKEALRVSREIAKLIALALDLDADFFDRPKMLDEPIATLRLLHYDGGKISDPRMGIYGCGAHSDYGLITLLATDDVAGLQICKDKDVQPQIWEFVPPLKGGFIVNLGDMLERWSNGVFRYHSTSARQFPFFKYYLIVTMLERWSNGVFRSTLHRVVVDGQERYSIAYFVEPSHECLVECLPSCTSEMNPPKYPAITCSQYLSQRYKDTHLDLSSYHDPQTRGQNSNEPDVYL